MTGFVAKKLVLSLLSVLGGVTLVFLLIHLIPGDPVENILGEQALLADKERLRHALRLDQPLHVQYGRFLGDIAGGTLGFSFVRRDSSVASLVAARFPRTLELATLAMLVAVALAVPLGVAAARRKGTAVDAGTMAFAMAGISLPSFVLGPLLLLFFCRVLAWFPPPAADAGFRSAVLPAVTLGVSMAALLSRMTRAAMVEALSEDYVTTARAKGVPERLVVWRHAWRNALIPVVTIVGLQFGALLSGAIITERVFAWPGIGTLLIESIEKRDFPVVQGCMLVIAASYVAVNLATDVIYAVIDPRVRRRDEG
ncbi:MAG: ABC transporter permease [Deltaproteobacteria bacterium]|nr:ABC transporter permease [Deltaproteobacteria bacterium]